MVMSAVPWMTWISRTFEKSARRRPKATALTIIPTSSITQSSATTFGRACAGARSVASARPTVCVVWSPAPTSTKASAAAICPAHNGPVVSPDRSSSAKGMIASPPNCSSVPNQM